jgi:membrane carboxypeptidase/penicillin-binding protein PbpC
MLEETNIEEFFILPENPQKSDVNRHAINSEDRKKTLSRCKHLSTIKELMEQFANNFNLPASNKKKVKNAKHCTRKRSFLIVLSDEEVEDVTSLNKKNKDKIVTNFIVVIDFISIIVGNLG